MHLIKDIEVHGKHVLLRTGLNVPIDASGAVGDVFRLTRALATIEYLSGCGARTIIIGHLGRGGDSLRPVYEKLVSLTKVPIRFFDGGLEAARSEAEKLHDGECLVLENIRRSDGEEKNDPALARSLADLGDLYVNDAFADSHRAHASIVGVAALLPSYAGLLMEEEVSQLSGALTPPSGSVAIVGGAKFETKQPLIEKLLGLYGEVCVGGAIANDFLKARGLNVGTSLVSGALPSVALANDPRVLVQTDVIVRGEGGVRTCSVDDIHSDEAVVDAGPQTTEAWRAMIEQAPLVLWNGPLGVYEDGFTAGTDALAEAIDAHARRAIVGGGDTLAAIEKYSFDPSCVFLSTGGGAMLEFLTAGTLPGIEALG